jgi:hypothetical protein
MRDLRRKLSYHLRAGGLRGLGRKLLAYVRQEIWSDSQWLVYERSLTEDLPSVCGPLIRRELAFADLEKLGYDKALAFPEGIKRRFEDRNTCHGFYAGDDLATTGWSSPEYLELDQDVRLPCPGSAGLFDFNTFEQFRSRGYYTKALVQLLVVMREIGFRSACIAVDPGNAPSIKGIERAGFRLKLRVVRRRRLGMRAVLQQVAGSQ